MHGSIVGTEEEHAVVVRDRGDGNMIADVQRVNFLADLQVPHIARAIDQADDEHFR